MASYIVKRLLLILPTLFGIVLVSFLVLQMVPGGPVEQMLSQYSQRAADEGGSGSGGATDFLRDRPMDPELLEELKVMFGFDKPIHVRFWNWVVRLFTFDFGESYFHRRTVVELVMEKLPVSISLGGWSFLLTYMACIPLGIRKAVKDGTRFDAVTSVIILVGWSIPGFVLGIFLLVLLGGGSFWDVFPLRGLHSDNAASLGALDYVLDYLWHLVLPLVSYMIGSFTVLTLLTKNSFLDEINKQYVYTARAKGLSERVVLWKHVFRNAIIPVILGFPANFLGLFFTGSILIETIFSLDGIGLLSFNAIIGRDYPIVMGTLFFFSMLALIGNLLSDLSLVLVDPRISFERAPGG